MNTQNGEIMSKEHSSKLKKVIKGQSWNNLSNSINKIVLDYNQMYKTNAYESMLIQINNSINEMRL